LSVQHRVHGCRRRAVRSVRSREVQDYHWQFYMPQLRRGKVFDCNRRFFRRNLPDMSGVFELGNWKRQLSVQRRVHRCRRRAVRSVHSREVQDYHWQLSMPRLRRRKVFDCNWRFF
jgi:hypothetical protein